ncbi:MAG: TetR family transcriptional regulator C-terminal domain-containing protein [Roseburia sp.]|nr:TetR family transcriptional regulator C-terminal domain-containing protein [Roseburia sp.]
MTKDRRTKRTEALLRNAFINLLSGKKLNEITVKELCDIADINRGTFYLHYADVYDLKQKLENETCLQLEAIVTECKPPRNADDAYTLFLMLFCFAEKNALFFKTFLGPNGDIAFLKKMQILFKERYLEIILQGKQPHNIANLDYSYNFIASGFTGLVENWLTNENPPSKEEMARLTTKIIYDDLPSLMSFL